MQAWITRDAREPHCLLWIGARPDMVEGEFYSGDDGPSKCVSMTGPEWKKEVEMLSGGKYPAESSCQEVELVLKRK